MRATLCDLVCFTRTQAHTSTRNDDTATLLTYERHQPGAATLATLQKSIWDRSLKSVSKRPSQHAHTHTHAQTHTHTHIMCNLLTDHGNTIPFHKIIQRLGIMRSACSSNLRPPPARYKVPTEMLHICILNDINTRLHLCMVYTWHIIYS